jgi:hypothetical protein
VTWHGADVASAELPKFVVYFSTRFGNNNQQPASSRAWDELHANRKWGVQTHAFKKKRSGIVHMHC